MRLLETSANYQRLMERSHEKNTQQRIKVFFRVSNFAQFRVHSSVLVFCGLRAFVLFFTDLIQERKYRNYVNQRGKMRRDSSQFRQSLIQKYSVKPTLKQFGLSLLSSLCSPYGGVYT